MNVPPPVEGEVAAGPLPVPDCPLPVPPLEPPVFPVCARATAKAKRVVDKVRKVTVISLRGLMGMFLLSRYAFYFGWRAGIARH